MKVRQRFVSNSSSSSFIIATPDNTKVSFEIDLASLGDVVTTEEELEQAFLKDYGEGTYDTIQEFLEDDEWLTEKYTACLQAIARGEKIVLGTVYNDGDNGLETFVYENGIPETEGMTIITGK